MSYSRTVGETFYSPDFPVLWMTKMRNWSRFGMTSYCSIVCCESSACLWLKKLGHEGRRVLAKITEFGLKRK